MAIQALPISKEFPYVCKDDRENPESEQTIWWIKVLSYRESSKIEDFLGATDGDDFKVYLGTQEALFLHSGLLRVENFQDENGKELLLTREVLVDKKFQQKLIKDAFLNRIPRSIRKELAKAIESGPVLEEEEAKNS